jgi:nicotinamidase-related amidase
MVGWRESFDKTPRFVEDFELDPQATALMIIDMQYSNAHPDYGIGRFLKENYPEAAAYYFDRLNKQVLPNQIKLLGFFRKNRMRLTYLTVGPTLPDHSDYKRPVSRKIGGAFLTSKLLAPAGTFEHSILEELKPQKGELVLNKTSAGAFNSTGLDMILRNMGITDLVIAGVASHACVETTSRDAADRGYVCVLVDDACATHSQELHDGTMRSFAAVSGRVLNTDEIIAFLEKQLNRSSVRPRS